MQWFGIFSSKLGFVSKGRQMSVFVVKWIVDGEIVVEADNVGAAEKAAEEALVAVLSDENKWPAAFGTKGIQGAAEKVER